MENTFLVMTSIADQNHPALKMYSIQAPKRNIPFIVIGDTKSPKQFNIPGCDYYSVEKQNELKFKTAKLMPFKHYARKNIGYLVAMSKGAKIIIETDDDNYPIKGFWDERELEVKAHWLEDTGWTNVYKYFTNKHVWPRGFALEHIQQELPKLGKKMTTVTCPIQMGLPDENPDVDAIYRLTMPLPIKFKKGESIALGNNSICPFNSQNTTWFKQAFPLLYLPYYSSIRMTDIWRGYIAERIAWTCGWPILFHQCTLRQERNDHNLMTDFKDEICGYTNNKQIFENLQNLKLKRGVKNIPDNMRACYKMLIGMELVGKEEMALLNAWLKDVESLA